MASITSPTLHQEQMQLLQEHKQELDALEDPNAKKKVRSFGSPEYRVKESSPKWYVTALSVLLIVAGIFAFLVAPLLAAGGILPMSFSLLAIFCCSGLAAVVIGMAILACANPKKKIPVPRSFEIAKEQEKAEEAKVSKTSHLNNATQRLDLETGGN